MLETSNGSDDSPEQPEEQGDGLTLQELRTLTVGQLLDELERSGEVVLLVEAMVKLSGPEANPVLQPGSNFAVMVTRSVGYIEHVKARMRREARKLLSAEAKKALDDEEGTATGEGL